MSKALPVVEDRVLDGADVRWRQPMLVLAVHGCGLHAQLVTVPAVLRAVLQSPLIQLLILQIEPVAMPAVLHDVLRPVPSQLLHEPVQLSVAVILPPLVMRYELHGVRQSARNVRLVQCLLAATLVLVLLLGVQQTVPCCHLLLLAVTAAIPDEPW